MNKWKTAFWCCLSLLIFFTVFSLYLIIDQGATLTYQKEGYSDTEHDLDQLIEILSKTDLTKKEIKRELIDHKFYENMDFNSDSISLGRVLLIFDNERLKKVVKQY